MDEMMTDFVFNEDKLRDVNWDSDLFYDLTDGRYIKPEELLEDQELAQRVNEAAKLVASFLRNLSNEAEEIQSEEDEE